MKIIAIDNFGRDEVSDKLIAENVIPHYAYLIVNKLNEDLYEGSPYFYKAVDNDYKLYKFNRDY